MRDPEELSRDCKLEALGDVDVAETTCRVGERSKGAFHFKLEGRDGEVMFRPEKDVASPSCFKVQNNNESETHAKGEYQVKYYDCVTQEAVENAQSFLVFS